MISNISQNVVQNVQKQKNTFVLSWYRRAIIFTLENFNIAIIVIM